MGVIIFYLFYYLFIKVNGNKPPSPSSPSLEFHVLHHLGPTTVEWDPHLPTPHEKCQPLFFALSHFKLLSNH